MYLTYRLANTLAPVVQRLDCCGFARTNLNPAITTANTARLALYKANAGIPNNIAKTATAHPARPGTQNATTDVINAAQPMVP
jgi:hypothetical protein